MKTLLYNGAVELEFDATKHSYVVTEGGVSREVPSVTTVLGIIDKSGPLTQWAANCAIESLRKSVLPDHNYTAEQLEERFQDARFNFRKISKTARDVGTSVHAWIESYIRSVYDKQPQPELPTEPQAMNACYAASEWLRTHDFTPLAIEQRIYSRSYRYAGTMDFPALVDGELSVVDWKTSKAIYGEYRIQCAAYAEAYGEMVGTMVKRRYVVRIGKDDGEFEVAEFNLDTQARDLLAFLSAQDLYLALGEIKNEGKLNVNT